MGNGKNTHDHSRASLQVRPLHMTLFTEQKPATTGGQGWCRPNYPVGTDLQSVAFADSLLTHKVGGTTSQVEVIRHSPSSRYPKPG